MASTESAYATGDHMVLYHSPTRLGQLLSDSNSPVTVVGNDTLDEFLLAASGRVESACQVGGRYSVADLEDIRDASPATGATSLLRKLVCDLAYYDCEKRKAPDLRPEDVSGVEAAEKLLEDLREGIAIFPTDAAVSAGNMSAISLNSRTDGNQTVDQARRFFGTHGG